MHYEVRMAEPELIPVVHAIMLAAFEEYRSADVPSSALNETAEGIREKIMAGKERAILCYGDGVPLGSGRFHVDAEAVYFSRLAVVPHARGRGIARSMVAWLETFADVRGKSRLWCRVRMSIPANIQLYKTLGFVEETEETVVNPNGFPVRTVVMSKSVAHTTSS